MTLAKLLAVSLTLAALSACGMYSGQSKSYSGHSQTTMPTESGEGYYPDTGNGN